MSELQKILTTHKSGGRSQVDNVRVRKKKYATTAEIPNLFFDEILVDFKLNRFETILLMFLYRKVWCYPNLDREYGISPVIEVPEIERTFRLTHKEVLSALSSLENHQLIETIRPNQYFVRRYFTNENDNICGQNYDDFL